MNTTLHPADSDLYLIINNGARVLQGKYHPFSKFVSQQGINVVTYDYQGMGGSKATLQNSKKSMRAWANEDLEEAIGFTKKANPHAKIFIMGHSLGGQMVGLARSNATFQGVILIAAQSGYWRLWSFPLNLVNFLTWRVYMPLILTFLKYLPKWDDQNLCNMPGHAVGEWMRWCQSKNYLLDHIPASERFFEQVKCPILSLSFSHDIYASRKAVDWLTSQYSNAKIVRKHYVTEGEKYGHSSPFEPSHFNTIGKDIVDFIQAT